ncbi:hypothetical protein [Bradyrhizobium ottawaense]
MEQQSVKFRSGVEVTDVDFEIQAGRKQATGIHWLKDGVADRVSLGILYS